VSYGVIGVARGELRDSCDNPGEIVGKTASTQALLFASPQGMVTALTAPDGAVDPSDGTRKRKAGLTFLRFALGCEHNSRYDDQQIRRL
jgi:hypothetical protein